MSATTAPTSPKHAAAEPHQLAAAHHTAAAHHHLEAAHHHNMGEHDDAKKHAKAGLEHSDVASKATSSAQAVSHK